MVNPRTPRKGKVSSKKSKGGKIPIIENGSGEHAPKAVKSKENAQLIWFFLVVIVIFGSFIGPYLYIESLGKFNYGEIRWVIEDYQNLKIYHGMFPTITQASNTHNIFLRIDPRENDVTVNGKLNNFRYSGIISLSREMELCRGDSTRAILDLGNFLRGGVGMTGIGPATSDWEFAQNNNRSYADCSTDLNKTVIMVGVGVDSWILQSPKNPDCYVIEINGCDDISSIEKFIVRSVSDFRERD